MLDAAYLSELLAAHPEAAKARVEEFSIGDHAFAFDSAPSIMGVINLSPDSWYRESVCLSTKAGIQRGRLLSTQGAAIVDVGAESTLAHSARTDATSQNAALLPVIRELSEQGIIVSVETYLPEVARTALEAGARVLNLTGTESTGEIFRMAADHEAAVIVCYVQGTNVREAADFEFGDDPVARMQDYFARQIDAATSNGVQRLFIDPGLGFYYRNLQDSAKRIRYQMQVFLNTFRLRTLGWPVCHALPHAFEFFAEEVRCAEPFFAVLATLGRTDLLRTHEVPRVKAVLETMAAY